MYFKPLTLICGVSTSLLHTETLRSKGCKQPSQSQVTDQGSSTPAPAYGSLLPLPSHRYHPQPTTSGLSASWQGTEVGRGDQRITDSAFSCHSSQDKLRDTNTCLATRCAVMRLRGLQDYYTHPLKGTEKLIPALNSHPTSIKTSSRILGAEERISNSMPRNHPSCAKQQLWSCAMGSRETPWLRDLYTLLQQSPDPCWEDT